MKRIIGRRFSDQEVQSEIPFLPYQLKKGPNDSIVIVITHECGAVTELTPEQVSALILTKLKVMAQEFLGCAMITDAGIHLPL